MPKTPRPLTQTERTSAYRDRVKESGGKAIYANLGADATKCLDLIVSRKGYSIAGAIEFALLKTAKELTRSR